MSLYTVNDLINDESINKVEHIATGCKNFDSLTGGILKGAVTVIAAPTGNGKSLVSAHLASALSKENIILYLTFDNNLATEKERFTQIFEHNLYNCNINNIIFPKDNMKEINDFTKLIKYLKLIQETQTIDIIILDGLDKLAIEKKEEETGATLHQDGNVMIKELIDTVQLNETSCIIMTWQLRSGCKLKDVYNVTSDDCAKSIGIARYAEEFFIVKKDYGKDHKLLNWSIRVDKARNVEDNKLIHIQDQETIINLDKNILDDLKNLANKFTNGEE